MLENRIEHPRRCWIRCVRWLARDEQIKLAKEDLATPVRIECEQPEHAKSRVTAPKRIPLVNPRLELVHLRSFE